MMQRKVERYMKKLCWYIGFLIIHSMIITCYSTGVEIDFLQYADNLQNILHPGAAPTQSTEIPSIFLERESEFFINIGSHLSIPNTLVIIVDSSSMQTASLLSFDKKSNEWAEGPKLTIPDGYRLCMSQYEDSAQYRSFSWGFDPVEKLPFFVTLCRDSAGTMSTHYILSIMVGGTSGAFKAELVPLSSSGEVDIKKAQLSKESPLGAGVLGDGVGCISVAWRSAFLGDIVQLYTKAAARRGSGWNVMPKTIALPMHEDKQQSVEIEDLKFIYPQSNHMQVILSLYTPDKIAVKETTWGEYFNNVYLSYDSYNDIFVFESGRLLPEKCKGLRYFEPSYGGKYWSLVCGNGAYIMLRMLDAEHLGFVRQNIIRCKWFPGFAYENVSVCSTEHALILLSCHEKSKKIVTKIVYTVGEGFFIDTRASLTWIMVQDRICVACVEKKRWNKTTKWFRIRIIDVTDTLNALTAT